MRTLFLLVCIVAQPFLGALAVQSKIHSDSVVLINGKTGKVLWEKQPDMPAYPASTTKIATVFYVLMQKPNGLKERVVAQKEALACISPIEKRRDNYSKYPSYYNETDGSHAGIKLGEEMSVEDLLYATMLASGNDATNILAQSVGRGSIDAFMVDLNAFVKRIGCENTNFCNPHGLHHPEHKTTARDMARLAQCAMYHPMFCKIAKTQSYERPATNKQPRAFYTQTNRLLRKGGDFFYPHAVGIKTGYHSKAQHALVAAAEKDGRLLICAMMRCKDRINIWQDAKNLFDAAFNERLVEKEVLMAGNQPFSMNLPQGTKALLTYTSEPLKVSYYPSEEPAVRCLLEWDVLEFPVNKDQRVGQIRLLSGDEQIASVALFAKERVEAKWYAKLLPHLKEHMIAYGIGAAFVMLLLFTLLRRRR